VGVDGLGQLLVFLDRAAPTLMLTILNIIYALEVEKLHLVQNSFTSKLDGGNIHKHMHSSVDVPLDIDRPAGEREFGVYLSQRLH
jgi:hypothetical protein